MFGHYGVYWSMWLTYIVAEVTNCKQADDFRGQEEIYSEPGGVMDYEEDRNRPKRYLFAIFFLYWLSGCKEIDIMLFFPLWCSYLLSPNWKNGKNVKMDFVSVSNLHVQPHTFLLVSVKSFHMHFTVENALGRWYRIMSQDGPCKVKFKKRMISLVETP